MLGCPTGRWAPGVALYGQTMDKARARTGSQPLDAAPRDGLADAIVVNDGAITVRRAN
jgi:hypothetical protein